MNFFFDLLDTISNSLDSFLNHHLNQLYLRYFCQYLRTDEYGNRIFQAPYLDPDVVKLVQVKPEQQRYLITYHYWWIEDDSFYDEYLTDNDLIWD